MSKESTRSDGAKALEQILGALERVEKKLNDSLRLRAAGDQVRMRQRLRVINKEDLDVMRATIEEHVHPAHVEEARDLSRQRLAQLLIMQRTYELQIYSHYSEEKPGNRWQRSYAGLKQWVREVFTRPDFHIVHLRQGRYYPAVASEVNRILYALATKELGRLKLVEYIDGRRITGQEQRERKEAAEAVIETALTQEADNWAIGFLDEEVAEDERRTIEKIVSDQGLQNEETESEVAQALIDERGFLVAQLSSPP